MNMLPPLQTWPTRYRKLIAVFISVAFTGFLIGVIFLEVTTHMTANGIVTQYKGVSKEQMSQVEEMKFPKPAKDMLVTTHNHIMGLSTLFAVVGFLFLHTGDGEKWRMYVAAEPLISLVVTFGGLWIVRYLWSPFVYVVLLSGILMVSTFAWMCLSILYNCRAERKLEAETVV